MEAVLVAMSCFRYLCEEAEIRCGAEDIPVQSLLANYNTFMEFASISNMMITGLFFKPVFKSGYENLFCLRFLSMC